MQWLLLFLTYILTHPLDGGPFSEYNLSEINTVKVEHNIYISQINGVIEEITQDNNKYIVKISNDLIEIIIPGLDQVYKNVSDEIKIGDKIGEDNDLSLFSRFVLIQYNNALSFPQFKYNKLHFLNYMRDAAIHSMNPGILTIAHFEPDRGNCVEITNYDNISKIQYWHLSRPTLNQLGYNIHNNAVIGYLGSTGLTSDNKLTIYFADTFYELRAIYIKIK